MTNGYGDMYSFAGRIAPADRWAIAAYIRALQLSACKLLRRCPMRSVPRCHDAGTRRTCRVGRRRHRSGAGAVGMATGANCVSSCLASCLDLVDWLAVRLPRIASGTCADRRTLGRRHCPQLLSGIGTLPLLVPTLLPLMFVLPALYPWWHPDTTMHFGNGFYLNRPFAVARAIIYLVAWYGVAATTMFALRFGRIPPTAPYWSAGPGPDGKFRRDRCDHVTRPAFQLQRLRHDGSRRGGVACLICMRATHDDRATIVIGQAERPRQATARPIGSVGLSRFRPIADRLARRSAA